MIPNISQLDSLSLSLFRELVSEVTDPYAPDPFSETDRGYARDEDVSPGTSVSEV